MAETNDSPLLDRLALESEFSGYTPPEPPAPLPNVPYTNVPLPSPRIGGDIGAGGGTRSTVESNPLTAYRNSLQVNKGGDGRLTGGSIMRTLAESTSARYNSYVPGDYNNEDAYAQGQSWTDRMANGVGKGLLLTGTTFLQNTVGLVNGLARWRQDGKFASFYNNDFNRWLDDINKQAEDIAPNYETDVEKNAAWYSPKYLFTANFLWNGIVKNAGFAAGSALSGAAFAAALKAIPLTARLFSIGKAAQALEASEKALLSANKAADTYGKIKALSDRFLSSYNVLNPAGRFVVAGLSTSGEAGMEAFQNLNKFRDEKIREFKETHGGREPIGDELELINKTAEDIGNTSFLLNTGLLSATNYIQFPKILGSSEKLEKGLIKSLARETDEIIKDATGKYIRKEATSKAGKLLSGLNKIRPYVFSTSEAFEEGAQYAVGVGAENYYNKKYDGKPTTFLDSLVYGIENTLGTNEGMKNVVIGGLSGSLMQARGTYRERAQRARNTSEALKRFNEKNLSDFTKETADSVNRGTVIQEEREKRLRQGDILESKDLEADYIINYLTPRIKFGRYDLVAADIAEYRALASTDEGFAQLQAEGKALDTDNKEAYLKRLSNLESTANNIKSLYQSLNLRYAGLVDKENKPLYTSAVIDKMIYAATKVTDYDKRSVELSENLIKNGVDVDNVINDVVSGESVAYNEAIGKIEDLHKNGKINDDQKEDLIRDLKDVSEVALRRQLFMKEYDEIKNSPEKYKELPPQEEVIEEELQEEKKEEDKQKIKLKTKTGEREYEVGVKYFVGKGFDYDKDGLEIPISVSNLTILGENEDGTIKIKDNKGEERNISKDMLLDYELTKVSSVRDNKTANYFLLHKNEIFEYNFGEQFGGKKPGRLEYKDGKLFFVYKDNNGKIKRKVLKNEHFVAQGEYTQPRIKKIGEVETSEQEASRKELTSPEEIARQKSEDTLAKNRGSRIEIIVELENETRERLEEINKKLENKKKELENIQKDLNEIGDEVKVAQPRTKREKALEEKYPELSRQKIRFSKVFSATTQALTKLSRMKESVEDEINALTAEKAELEFNLSYFEDFTQNLDELPENSGEFLRELKEQVKWIELLVKETGDNINTLSKIAKDIESAIKDFVSLLKSSLQKFDADYPQYIKDSFERIKDNPIFSEVKGLKEYLVDYALLQDLQKDISINENQLTEADEQIKELYDKLNQLGAEYNAKKAILDRFQSVADAYKLRKDEEDRLFKNEQLISEALGTVDNDVQTEPFSKEYEPTAKKSTIILPRATMGVMRGKPHQVRANNFGFNLERFPNRDNIRGVYVTSKNENEIVPGLTDRLRMDEAGQINEDINKDEIIALVMVEEDADGNITLVGEDGQPIPEGVNPLDAAIYQVFPDGDLKWGAEYDNASMFRKDTPQEVRDSVTAQYKTWRTSVLENPNLLDRHTIGASFGRTQNVTDADGKIIYETRTSVQDANLISAADLESSQLINIPTLPSEGSNLAVLEQGTTTLKTPIGSVVLELPNGLVKLQNRKHTQKEAETIYQVIHQLAKNMLNPQVGIKSPESERLFNWLKSVIYWGIPINQNKERKPAGYNSIFFEKDPETGKFMLSISGKGKDFPFTPTSLEENKDEIILLLSNMYNNVKSHFTKQLNESYEEILSISPKGEVISRTWKNYQSYLLSNTTPDGKKRSGEELPLSTTMRPVVNEEDINRTDIYFYTADTADDFVIPVVEKKKVVTPKVLTPGAPTKPAPKAPVSKEAKPAEAAPSTYKLDGKTFNTFVSPNEPKRKIIFVAPANTNAQNFMTKIQIMKGEDLDAAVEAIKKAGKDPATELKKAVYNAIAPTLAKMQKEEDQESITIPDEEEGITIEGGEEELVIPEDVQEVVVADASAKMGKPISQSILDTINKRINGASDEALRVVINQQLKSFVPENWNQVETWLKANFPNVPVYRVKNIIQATNGKQAWGMFKDGAIYIYENAEVGTVYHEVFHAVWRMFSDPMEQKAVIDEMRGRSGKFFDRASLSDIRYSEATEEQLEERLAEEFRDYIQFKKIPQKPEKGRPYILKLFADMLATIKEFFLGRDSDSKVEEMFSKIGKGYYKSNLPLANNLAYAKQGIIDVEDAFADSDAVLSLAGINDRERNDIIQHMTYLTLTGMIKTDESLFEVENVNKTELYNKLKTQILETIAVRIQAFEDAVKDKTYTQEQVNPYISNDLQLMQNIEDQWNTIVERHQEYLKSYQIEFDENENLMVRDEHNSGKGDYQDASKIDNFKKASSAIKLLLSTIPQVNSEGKLIRSSINGALLLPVGKTYISLMNNLHNSASIEEMLNNLRKMAEDDVNYRTLYKRITKRSWKEKGVDLGQIQTQHGLQLISSLWNTFKKQNPSVKNVFILENGEVVVGEANLASAGEQIRNEYINSIVFKAKEGKGFFVYNEKEKAFIGDPSKLAKITNLGTPAGLVSFLKQVGIPFSMEDIAKMTHDQYKKFKEATLGIKESISKTEKIATFSGKALGMRGRLLELALVRAAISNPEFSSTYFNVSGERTQSYIGTNAASDLRTFLSKVKMFNKESVGGTQYNYLLTDSFAKYSNVLDRMFASNGKRKEGSEDLFEIGYVGGTVDEEKGKRKESSRLTYRQRLVQELNLNIKGWYLNLVPGDASLEWMIKLGNAISPSSVRKGMGDINEIFKGYFLSELELVREDRPVAKGRTSGEMRFFKGILANPNGKTEEEKNKLHNDIIASKKTPEQVYKDFEKQINQKLEEFMTKDMNKLKTVLSRYGILQETAEGFSVENTEFPKNMTEKELNVELMALTANYMIANIEMHKLLYSDPYQYEDELKRIKNFNSPRQAIINSSSKMNTAFNNIWNKGFNTGDIGFTKFTRDYFRSATHKDVIGIIDLPNYEKFKETDGAGIITMKANRHFRIRASDWNSDEERQYRYDVAWEKNDKGLDMSPEERVLLAAGNPGIQSAYTPIKPIVSGSKLSKNGTASSYNNVMLDKFALYPLSYRIMKQINSDANAIKLYDKMQKEDIDYVVFASSRKVGAQDPHETYIDGQFNTALYSEKNITNVPFSIMSIQAEVPSKDTSDVTRGSQITKLITLDFMEAGVPVDFMKKESSFSKRYRAWYAMDDDGRLSYNDGKNLYKTIKENQDLLEALIEEGYKTTLERLGIKETITKDGRKYEITDFSKAAQTLRDEMLKREINDNASDALTGFLEGKAVLEATPAYQQVRNIIYSIADKQFISPKINGGMKVQIPSTLLESGVRKLKDGFYESDILKFYEKDGKRVAEVMLGRWFDSPLSDEELINYLNNTEEGQKILSGVGYRIPTQKQNSVDVIVIKKFLPKEFKDSVVIPAALVQKVGSDFDIDKLSIYLKNVYIKNGKPKLIPYFGIGQQAIDKFKELFDKGEFLSPEEMKELDRYIAEETLLMEDEMDDVAGKLMRSIFGKFISEEELTGEFMRDVRSKDQIVKKLYKKSLENGYIQNMENLITSDENYDNLIKPNSAEVLKKLSEKIAQKTVGQTFDYKNIENMLDRTFMSSLRHAFVTGKYAIGIAAVNQTNHSLNQRQPIYIDKSRLDRVSEDDRFWLTNNPDIKFEEYNSIEIDGKMVPTLSMIKNKAGEYISDIIGMFIDGYVDISKGPWIMELGATPNVASTWLFLVKLGVPINTVAYFMNQPIIRDYLRTIESAGYSWLFIDSFVELQDGIYEDEPMLPKDFEAKLSQFTIPSETSLEKTLGKKINELNKQQRLEQRFMLREFLKYAKMAEHMFHVTQGSNYDTASFNDPYLIFKKQMQQIKAQNTIISSVDTLLSNSFVGKLAQNINQVRDAFAQILKSDSPKVRAVIQSVLAPYVNMSDREFVKVAQKAVADLFDWAVQTDQNLNREITDILINDGGVGREVVNFVNQLKESNDPLANNEIIRIIEGIPSMRAAKGGVNNVKLNMAENKVYDQNNVIYAFRELRNRLKSDNNPLYDRIVTLAILQSGLSNSPISFTSLIPYEDFERIYNQTLSKLEGLSNLDHFHKLGVFERNNWNNDEITPYLKASLITSKKTGKKYYNPSMKFLPNPVQDAVRKKEIPPILTRSKNNREANFDYIVYTWEKEEDLLTKEEIEQAKFEGIELYKVIKEKKNRMRKAADFSFINKGLFRKVYDNYGTPLEHITKDGDKYFVYKAINAWGDSFRANEFYDVDHKSVIENGFIQVEDVDNNVIISKFLQDPKSYKKSVPTQQAPTAPRVPLTFEKAFSPERQKQILKNYRAKHKVTEDEALAEIMESIALEGQLAIKKLKECY